jgi:uncharacterized protein (TIGR02687 family)
MSEVSSVRPHLERCFFGYRLVFWHDSEGQYATDIDNLDLAGVTTLRVANDEYAIRHRILHLQPEDKFLIYRAGEMPDDTHNWLLDLELGNDIFTADRGSLLAQELGLSAAGIDDVVGAHGKFFNAGKRVETLKTLLVPSDDAAKLQAKMSAVVVGQKEHSLLELTRTLLVENAKGQRLKFDGLVDFGLEDFYWNGVSAIYGYESATPSVDDFVLWIFRKAIDGFESDLPSGLRNIQLDFASFRNDRRSESALASLAKRASVDLDYKSMIEGVGFRDLVSADLFEESDRKIIAGLASAVTEQTISAREVSEIVRSRQSSVWIDNYRQLYLAIDAAAELLAELSAVDFSFTTFDEGFERYCSHWYRIDQLYRQFTRARRTFEGPHPLDALSDEVEKRYTNKFVYELGNAWQKQVDEADTWAHPALRSQRSFYKDFVERLVRDDKKAVVIISDALRYEVAEELGSRIRQEDRFDASLEAMLGVLPSFTQLGMAALLPHSSLRFSTDGKTVFADEQSTSGTVARSKILEDVGGRAIQAEDFRALSADERRELFRANQTLYVFHNRIDATGDKLGTERQVFEAVEDTLRDLVDLVKKLASANATNLFITADHGFLFQDDELPEQFYLSERPQGDEILVTNRRYVLGHGLKVSDSFTTFSSEQLQIQGDLEVQIPKSIHRLKLAGGGSRFVHGGATLQEVVVPVLVINKKRKSDTRPVSVQVLPDTDKVTTGQLVVKLFQSEPVSDKVQARVLRAGLYVGETLISNDPQPELVFDSPSEDQRDRYQSIQLLLNKDADNYNNRAVEFRLEERIPNTNHWRVYEKAVYTLKRSFTSDFDF